MVGFDYEGSSLVMKRNLWQVEAYDVMTILEGKKFLVEGTGVKEDQALHLAWKKDVITEQEYCRLIDKTLITPAKV